ncbi:hypothetical protein LBMAG44_10000 [Gemmatimonadota bacterium]|nr:hypothetical protein LBMAG44_10000 [Gemmatimonadota bacterium]
MKMTDDKVDVRGLTRVVESAGSVAFAVAGPKQQQVGTPPARERERKQSMRILGGDRGLEAV